MPNPFAVRFRCLAALVATTTALGVFTIAAPLPTASAAPLGCDTTPHLTSPPVPPVVEAYYAGPTDYVVVAALDDSGYDVELTFNIEMPTYTITWEERRTVIDPVTGKPKEVCDRKYTDARDRVWDVYPLSVQLTSSAKAWHQGQLGLGPRRLYPERFDAQLIGQIYNRPRPLKAYVGDPGYVQKTDFSAKTFMAETHCYGVKPKANNPLASVHLECNDIGRLLTDPGVWQIDGAFKTTGLCADFADWVCDNPQNPAPGTALVEPQRDYHFAELMDAADDLRFYLPVYYIEVKLGP